MTRAPGHTYTFTAPSLDGVVADAIAFIVVAGDAPAADHTTTLVVSGEGESPGDAMRHALDDIRSQCVDQRCTPVDVTIDGVMATDAGTRVWGTLFCTPGMTAALPPTEILDIDIVRKEMQWELTVTRR